MREQIQKALDKWKDDTAETSEIDLENEILRIAQVEAEKIIKSTVSSWIVFDWEKTETRPKKYGKYFVRRKDGKIHWETWNGSGWAYNGNTITHYQEIKPPFESFIN